MTGPLPPSPWPVPPAPPVPSAAPEPAEPSADESQRPAEVETGCRLWGAALGLLSASYALNLLVNGVPADSLALRAANAGFSTAVVATLVATLLLLMRSGYRWARVVLTGGSVVALIYVINGLFDADPRPAVAVPCGLAGIAGAVLISGGTWLLHRPEAQEYFTR